MLKIPHLACWGIQKKNHFYADFSQYFQNVKIMLKRGDAFDSFRFISHICLCHFQMA